MRLLQQKENVMLEHIVVKCASMYDFFTHRTFITSLVCSVYHLKSESCITHLYFFTMKMQKNPKTTAVPRPTTVGMMMWL